MNTYLNALKASRPNIWPVGKHKHVLEQQLFSFNLWAESSPQNLGLLHLYFTLSYHYALLSLTAQKGFHYLGWLCLTSLLPLR